MKKNIKKFIPAILALSMLGTSAVFADSTENKEETSKVAVSDSEEKDDDIKDDMNDDMEMEEKDSNKMLVVQLMEKNGHMLFPVREVFEELGFEVEYEPIYKVVTAIKSPLYVTFSSSKDAYTFAKMAPQKLGQAPVVVEGKTYVPVTLLTEIMGMEGISVEGSTLKIMLEDEKEDDLDIELKQNIITEIDKENNKITVMDFELGEVVLNIKDLKVEYTTEDKELMVGQAVEIVYGDEMTTSQPPMNTPKSLKVVTKYNIVKVLSVEEEDKNGNKKVLVEDKELGEVALIVSKETKMMEDVMLEKGQYLKVAMSNAMTMSLPPQTFAKEIEAISIEVEEDDNMDMEETEAKEVKVVSIDKENKQIIVEDKELGKVALNLDAKNIKIEMEDSDKAVEDIFSLVKEGQEIKVVFGDIMTKSLPPINTPVSIMLSK